MIKQKKNKSSCMRNKAMTRPLETRMPLLLPLWRYQGIRLEALSRKSEARNGRALGASSLYIARARPRFALDRQASYP